MASLTFEGGLNEQDVTLVKPQECIEGYNFELGYNDTHYRPRSPFDKLGTATNAGSINGILQLIKNNDTETTLVQAGDTVYLWDGSTTFTSKGTVNGSSKLRSTTWSLGGYSVITDLEKLTVVKTWDGTTFSTLTTGLGASLYAKYAIVHLGRVWLFNVTSGTNTPHLMVASAYETPTSYDTSLRAQDSSFTTGNEAFYMTTPDLLPINGVALFFNTLIISTDNGRIWKLTGTDSTDFAWLPFYSGSAAVGTETMANIGNDIVYMKRGGSVESLISTQDYGDVRADDLSRWIRNVTKDITDCRTVYDQKRQKVYFFNSNGSMPVLFKDMQPSGLSPWSVYKTDHTSNFDTSAAVYMRRPGGTDWFVYFGDSSGNIYQLEGTGEGDNGDTDIPVTRRTLLIEEIKDSEFEKGYKTNFDRLQGRVHYRRVADVDLVMDFEWGDDYSITQCTVPLEGPPVGDSSNYFGGSAYFGGAFYFNSGFFYSDRVSTKGFSPVGQGEGVYIDLSVTSSQRFDIIKIQV